MGSAVPAVVRTCSGHGLWVTPRSRCKSGSDHLHPVAGLIPVLTPISKVTGSVPVTSALTFYFFYFSGGGDIILDVGSQKFGCHSGVVRRKRLNRWSSRLRLTGSGRE